MKGCEKATSCKTLIGWENVNNCKMFAETEASDKISCLKEGKNSHD